MTGEPRTGAPGRSGLQLVRLVGIAALVDGLLRAAGRGGVLLGRPESRRLGMAESALGVALLEQTPIDPASLYRLAAPVYDRLAPIWRDWLYRDALRAFERAIVDALPAEGDVLDLGCGTGAVLEGLLARGARPGSYLGVDLSPAMLARARAKLGLVPGVRLQRLDLRREPLPAGPFDVVVSAWALEHLPRPGMVVAAARSRLRAGGTLIAFFELDGDSVRERLFRRLWRFFGARLVPEDEARSWPGLVSLRRFPALGPAAAVAVLA